MGRAEVDTVIPRRNGRMMVRAKASLGKHGNDRPRSAEQIPADMENGEDSTPPRSSFVSISVREARPAGH